MGRVLIDQYKTIFSLRDDVGLCNLPASDAHGKGSDIRRRLFRRFSSRHWRRRKCLALFPHRWMRLTCRPLRWLRGFRLPSIQRKSGSKRCSRLPCPVKRTAESSYNKSAHERRIPKPHFSFCRVNIDVHLRWWDLKKQSNHGMTITRKHVRIGTANRPRKQAILDGATIDKKILVVGDAPVERREPGHTRQTESLTVEIEADTRICQCAVREGGDTFRARLPRGHQQHTPAIMFQAEANIRPRHREPFDRIDTRGIFRARRPEEFAPRRDLVE